MSWIKNYIRKLRYGPIGLVYVYQRIISPLTSPACRFYPSCSSYARLAMEKHGIVKGGAMTLVRISKCHPFHPGGYDPVD